MGESTILKGSRCLVSLPPTSRNWEDFEPCKGSSSPFKGMGLVLAASSVIPSYSCLLFLKVACTWNELEWRVSFYPLEPLVYQQLDWIKGEKNRAFSYMTMTLDHKQVTPSS